MKKNESGFTLIEMVLVGALLAVIAGLTAPGLSGGLQRFAVERAASEMEDLSHYARNIAIMRGVPYCLSISKDEGSYRLGRCENGRFVPVEGSVGRQRFLPLGAKVQGPSQGVTYFPNGTAVGGPLDIGRGKETLWRLQVDPVLGEAHTVEGVSETAG
jgi:prepilin-type N-terminal cleavage/methylation domain-containing protein